MHHACVAYLQRSHPSSIFSRTNILIYTSLNAHCQRTLRNQGKGLQSHWLLSVSALNVYTWPSAVSNFPPPRKPSVPLTDRNNRLAHCAGVYRPTFTSNCKGAWSIHARAYHKCQDKVHFSWFSKSRLASLQQLAAVLSCARNQMLMRSYSLLADMCPPKLLHRVLTTGCICIGDGDLEGATHCKGMGFEKWTIDTWFGKSGGGGGALKIDTVNGYAEKETLSMIEWLLSLIVWKKNRYQTSTQCWILSRPLSAGFHGWQIDQTDSCMCFHACFHSLDQNQSKSWVGKHKNNGSLDW